LKQLSILVLFAAATLANAAVPITPMPNSVRSSEGEYVLQRQAFAVVPIESRELFLSTLNQAGADVRIAPADAPAAIQFLSADAMVREIPKPVGEGYVLRVIPTGITVYAATPAGMFYGLQSLAQLIEGGEKTTEGAVRLPLLEIADTPRFSYRGFMLDESRHFTGVEGVKRLLDGMGRYKLNRFHWHLTDSPGWRIEIKAYPKLTTVGGRGAESDRRPDAPAQFYTQNQVRDIVAYAKERGIVVIPEIDMPGHADAAVKAYPEHDGGGYKKWPKFTFNPAREETLQFLDTILKEVAELFPDAGIIHFGGDEVHFGWHKWPKLPEVQALMKQEGYKGLPEVEAWFNRRMAATINSLGFKTGGWDEIVARNLPIDQTVVYWWRHDKPDVLRRALDHGYPVVLAPRLPSYLDFVQHQSHQVGRRWKNRFNPLRAVYAFPAGLELSSDDEAKVLGIQACLWNEVNISQARRDFMTWPRLIALAEAAWTHETHKNFASFEQRLPAQLTWLESRGIGFYDPFKNSPEITDRGVSVDYLDMPED
jgi:hexosaminidase